MEKWIEQHIEYIFNDNKNFENSIEYLLTKIKKTGGKLYKYCFFDKEGYYISNLEKNLLHFSNIKNVNDPFDSTLGLSLDKVFEYVFKNSDIYKNIDDSTKPIIIKLLFKDEQSKVSKLLDDINVKDFLLACIKKTTKNDFSSLINKDINSLALVKDFMLQLQQDPQSAIFDILCELDADLLNDLAPDIDPKIVQLFLKIHKAENFFDKIEVINNSYLNAKINTNEIEILDRQMNELYNRIIDIINEKFGISCFTTDPANILMWAHYSLKHTGFCIEYDLNKLNTNSEMNLFVSLLPICYSYKRAMFPLDMFVYSDNKIVLKENDSNFNANIVKALITKSNIWNYENEWRIISPIANLDSNNNAILSCISAVYYGCNISNENKEKLDEIVKEKNIKKIQLYVDKEDYVLKILEVND